MGAYSISNDETWIVKVFEQVNARGSNRRSRNRQGLSLGHLAGSHLAGERGVATEFAGRLSGYHHRGARDYTRVRHLGAQADCGLGGAPPIRRDSGTLRGIRTIWDDGARTALSCIWGRSWPPGSIHSFARFFNGSVRRGKPRSWRWQRASANCWSSY
jgi:hypothetical protein